MKYKAIATDLDGTLLNDDKQISEVNRKAIQSTVVQALLLAQKKVTGIPNLTLETISLYKKPLI